MTDHIQQRTLAFLASCHCVLVSRVESPRADCLSESGRKLLIKFALEFGLTLVKAYRELGLHPVEGKRAVDELLASGFVKQHRIVRKGRGAQPVTLELTDIGKEKIAEIGLSPAEKTIKRGGHMHAVYGKYLCDWAKARGYRHWCERSLGGKAFDFVFEDESGNLLAAEVCLSGSAIYNADAARRGASVPGIKCVTMLFEDHKLLGNVEKELKGENEEVQSKIRLEHLSSYLPGADAD